MDLLEETRKICKLYNINPARSKGQNFLVNEDVYDQIIESADLDRDDTVLEVGPGLGFLTEKLSQKVERVLAVELDDGLAELLKSKLISDQIDNVELFNQDVIDFFGGSTPGTPGVEPPGELNDYKIVANLPYNISSIFLRTIFSLPNKPKSLTLMLQKEVAERIVAKAGKMSLLAISVQLYADAEIVTKVPGNDFWPAPDVESAVIHLDVREGKPGVNEKDFFRLVKFGFSAKRKMLKNNLSGGYRIDQKEAEEKIIKAGFNPKIRAQELSVEDWKKLLKEF